ncbi:MAG: acetyl-CoA carboxylase carboxyl transferase subunit beta [Legionellales bacterium]|jgi:acetyl-CoA carboxylase carboxyl transferase subunit beta|nr:acetyl-CoA carboxylase carboxyl transferase subunit beta [Legionellales bacterium]
MLWVDKKWPVPGHRVKIQPMQADQQSFINCRACDASIQRADFLAAHSVCPVCGHHHMLTGYERLDLLTGGADCELIGESLVASDVLNFADQMTYQERLEKARKKSDMTESVISAVSAVDGVAAVLSIFDFGFIGGSLGEVAGSRIALAIQTAMSRKLPFICVTASGGARMQEGVLSLFQMAKMSAAVQQLRQTRLPFFNVLTHPTFGGVTASIAMQADVIIAEKGAHIGFTGARVIANSAQQKLPDGFQTAEFLVQHGAIDDVVGRDQLVSYLGRNLRKALANQS